MDCSEALDLFRSLPVEKQPVFLLMIAHALTVVARESQLPQKDGSAGLQMLLRINEAQHRAIAQVINLILADEKRFPEDTLFEILYDYAPEEMGQAAAIVSNKMQNLRTT